MPESVYLKRLNNRATLYIDGEIDSYWMNQDYFRYMLSEVDPDEEIDLRVNSQGGDPFTALQIYAMLKRHKGKVTAYIEFMCASAVTMVVSAADEVVIANIGWYMIHRVSGAGKFASADDADAMANIMRTTESQMIAIYAEKTGKSEDDLRKMVESEMWMTAEQAKEEGFVDRIDEVIPMLDNNAARFNLAAKFNNVPKELTNHGHKQKADETQKQTMTMDLTAKIKGFFGLDNSADDIDVATTAKELKAKADQADALQKRIDELEAESAQKDEKISELESAQTEAEEKAEEQEDEELDTVLENAVKEFKIKASAKETFKERFKGDVPGLKNMLEEIPSKTPADTPSRPKTKNSAAAGAGVHNAVSKYFNN